MGTASTDRDRSGRDSEGAVGALLVRVRRGSPSNGVRGAVDLGPERLACYCDIEKGVGTCG